LSIQQKTTISGGFCYYQIYTNDSRPWLIVPGSIPVS